MLFYVDLHCFITLMHSSWQLLAIVLNHLKCLGPCSVVVKDKSKHTEILFLAFLCLPSFPNRKMRRRRNVSVDANIYFYCYFNFEWTRLFRLLTFTLSSLLFQLINLNVRMKHLSLWSPACVWMGPLEWAYWAIRSVSVYNLQLKCFSLRKIHQHEAIKVLASCHIPFV